MATKKRGLGRDLAALLGTSGAASETVTGAQRTAKSGDSLKNLPLDILQRGQYQPRDDMRTESLDDLAASIRAQGVVQPIVVRPLPGGDETRYEIIAGERRWRAAQIAGLDTIPAVIRNVPDEAAVAMSLIENIQRENLNPMEESRALHRLIAEFEMTHEQAAQAVGRSRSAVSNLLRLLELDESVRAMVEGREIEMGHARALLGLPAARQLEIARRVAREGMSARETERLVKQLKQPKKPKVAPKTDPNVRALESQLSEKLGARVSVQQSGKGKGKLVINYNSLDELEGIIEHIK
ncbi:MAG: ParB/RepB/Spo0J family partition protein [Gammaproteobacteria bacterium]|nr:ParB/RepB/Spo0J family partition protein [Gammaproteobacteria bacterium]